MALSIRTLLRSRHAPAMVVALLGSAAYVVWNPPSNDFSVQVFRGELFSRAPFAIWNNQWFAGHHTPSYSLVAPAVGSVLGPLLMGVASVIAASLLASLLVHRLVAEQPDLHHPRLAGALFATGALASLFGGRVTFLLGIVFAMATLLAAVDVRWWPTAAFAVVTGVTSPVAGVSVAIVGCGVVCANVLPRRVGAVLVVAPILPVAVLAVLFPEGGTFPYPLGGVLNTLALTAVVAVVGWRFALLRWLCGGYGAFVLLCHLVENPIGGNAARLGALAAPVVVVMVAHLTMRWLAVVVAPMLVVQWAPVSLVLRADRAQLDDAFYRPLIEFLDSRPGPMRVEVVPVVTHQEAATVALEVPIARGWNRQLDRKLNALFYGETLDADDYLAWLRDTGVSFVAIADTELDPAGELEADLLEAPPSYLREVFADGVWTVFEVQPSPPLAEGDAVMTELGIDDFTLEVSEPGEVLVRVRFSPWFTIDGGDACVRESDDGWTIVDARAAGEVRVAAALTWSAFVDRDGNC